MAKQQEKYSLGIDFGTNSVRAVIARCRDGVEISTGVCNFPNGGVLLDDHDPNLARQFAGDYLASMQVAVSDAVKMVSPVIYENIIGIGVDATGSTPGPVDESGTPLALLEKFKSNPNAMLSVI